jgi:nucleotide-binding universal stress UspA family protein
MKIDRILVPVDFSPQSVYALDFADRLARRLKAAIILVHVLDPLYTPGRLDSRRVRLLRAGALQDAKRNLTSLSERNRSVQHHVISGIAHKVIIGLATTLQADLIVMGASRRTGVKRILGGSVAAKVVRRAKCPVLVVRRKSQDEPKQNDLFI